MSNLKVSFLVGVARTPMSVDVATEHTFSSLYRALGTTPEGQASFLAEVDKIFTKLISTATKESLADKVTETLSMQAVVEQANTPEEIAKRDANWLFAKLKEFTAVTVRKSGASALQLAVITRADFDAVIAPILAGALKARFPQASDAQLQGGVNMVATVMSQEKVQGSTLKLFDQIKTSGFFDLLVQAVAEKNPAIVDDVKARINYLQAVKDAREAKDSKNLFASFA